MFVVYVSVVLPDGTVAELPKARFVEDSNGQMVLAQELGFATAKDAHDWARFCLPDYVHVREVEET